MRTRHSALAWARRVTICLGALTIWNIGGRASAEPTVIGHSEDVLEKVVKWNAGMAYLPAHGFRTGSVQRARSTLRINAVRGDIQITFPKHGRILAPAVHDGKVFVGGGFTSRRFYCIDVEDRRVAWSVLLSDVGPSAALYHNGIVLVNTESCTTFALDANTGRMIWSAWLGDPLTSMPAAAEGNAFLSYPGFRFVGDSQSSMDLPPHTHTLAGIRLATGRCLWRKLIDHDVISAPVIHDDAVYLATFAGTVYKLNRRDGKILLARRCRATSAPVVTDAGIYLTRQIGREGGTPIRECVTKLDRQTGVPVYEVAITESPYFRGLAQTLMTAHRGATVGQYGGSSSQSNNVNLPHRITGPSVAERQQYTGARLLAHNGALFTCMGNALRRIDAQSGETQWLHELPKPENSSRRLAAAPPVIAGGSLFVATATGNVLRIDPESGKVLKKHDVGSQARSEPIVSDGYAWVCTQSNCLVGVATGDARFTGWNQQGGNAAHTSGSRIRSEQSTNRSLDRVARAIDKHRSNRRPILVIIEETKEDEGMKTISEFEELISPRDSPAPPDVLDIPSVKRQLGAFQTVKLSLQEASALKYALDERPIEFLGDRSTRYVVFDSRGKMVGIVSRDGGRSLASAMSRATVNVRSANTQGGPDDSAETVKDDEQRAADQLRLARNLLGPNPAAAVKRLKGVVQDFPGTKAAERAKTLLDASVTTDD